MQDQAFVDFESGAVANLKRVGTYRYMQDPWLWAICLGWAINDDEIQLWKAGDPVPGPLGRHIERGGRINAWHAAFERGMFRACLPSWPQPRTNQFICTMTRALAVGLPGQLKLAAIAFGITERKDEEGAKALAKIMRPINLKEMERPGSNAEPEWTPMSSPYYSITYRYCKQDVRTEREMARVLPDFPDSEKRQYWYDQHVADRGVPVDLDLCRKAIAVADVRRAELRKQAIELCGYETTQVAQIVKWTNAQGVTIPDLKAATVKKLLADKKLPPKVEAVLQCRKESGKSSTAKFQKILDYVCTDGTVKGLRQFYGAHTGRFAGRGPQFDNLMRTTMKDIDDVVSVVKTGQSWFVESAYDNVLEAVANCARSVIVAEPGSALFVGDYKSIESRMLAFTSGQNSTNEIWLKSDRGEGPDKYIANAADMFGVDMRKLERDYANHVKGADEMRQAGKIAELLLGFEGGVGALAKGKDVIFRDLYPTMFKNADERTRDKVNWLWKLIGEKAVRGKENFNEKDWRAARFIVESWRAGNPMSVKLWKGLMQASVEAVRKPGTRAAYRGVSYRYDKARQMLFCRLMSGRELIYPKAHLVTAPNAKGDPVLQLRASYYHDKLKKYIRYHPYGGFLTENVIQAQARDIMVSRFASLEMRGVVAPGKPGHNWYDHENAPGYRLMHTVHDEIITQARSGSVAEFVRLATTRPDWAKGLPLAMDAWTGTRYKK